MMTATTKTFNIAGSHSGNVIIADPDLRARFGARMMAMGLKPKLLRARSWPRPPIPPAAPGGSTIWSNILDGNRKVFDAGVNAIPGLKSMDMAIDLSRVGRLCQHRHEPRRIHQPACNKTRASPRTTAPHLAKAERAFCASTSQLHARGLLKRWNVCRWHLAIYSKDL